MPEVLGQFLINRDRFFEDGVPGIRCPSEDAPFRLMPPHSRPDVMNRYVIEEILDRGQIGRRRVTTASLLGFQIGRMKPQRWCDTQEAPRRERAGSQTAKAGLIASKLGSAMGALKPLRKWRRERALEKLKWTLFIKIGNLLSAARPLMFRNRCPF